ncbi:MAG: LapA family protein [Acidobacteriota bacterium]
MRLLVIILTVFLFVLIVAFTLFNLSERVNVSIFFTEPYIYSDVPLFLVVIFAVLFGAIYTGIIALVEGMNLRLNNMRLKKTIKRMESELDYLRNLSISEISREESSPTSKANKEIL